MIEDNALTSGNLVGWDMLTQKSGCRKAGSKFYVCVKKIKIKKDPFLKYLKKGSEFYIFSTAP